MSTREPKVTVILASQTGIAESTPQLRNLRRQSLGDEMEVLVVAARGVVDPAELDAFGDLRIRLLELEEPAPRGRAAGLAVPHSRGRYVMLVENHSFLEADGIQRLAREEEWGERDAARSPVMRTGNPETLRSLAMFALVYGHCTLPAPEGPVTDLPFHNSMYRRDVLAELGDEVSHLMEDESRLHGRLVSRGYDLRLVPEVSAWHLNESRWRRAVTDPFALGLRFGQGRRGGWSWGRRALYAAALPAIAALRFRDVLGRARRAVDVRDRLGAIMPLLLLEGTSAAVGEVCGYLGIGPAPSSDFWRDFDNHEYHVQGRLAGVPPSDTRLREFLAGLPRDLP